MQKMQPKKIEVMDTTLRDGEQMDGVSFSPLEKARIAKLLLNSGVGRIEVASSRSVEQDEEAVRKICKAAYSLGKLDSIEVLGFVDGKKSVDWIADAGCRTMNLLAKGSRQHCEEQLGKTLDEHIEDIGMAVEYAASKGIRVNIYLEDWSAGIKDSPDYVFALVEAAQKMGVKRVMLPDTRGLLSYWQVEEYVKLMKEKMPGIHFDFHAHNDYGIATANTLAAIRGGIDGIHLTLNTLGERAGNSSLYEAAASAKDLLGIDLGLDESKFYELKRMVELASGIRLAPNAAIVGENSYKQTAGVHADGDSKKKLYHRLLAPERFGFGSGLAYSLGKQAGVASIEMNLQELGIEIDEETKRKVTHEVRRLGGLGKIVTQADLPFIINEVSGEQKDRPFEFLEAKSDVSMSGTRVAYIKVMVNKDIVEETATGDGGYDAIMNALRKALSSKGVQMPALVEYNPRIPPGGKTNALVETTIEWGNGRRFKTTGVDTDQTISAVKATEKMVNLVMMNYRRISDYE